MTLTKSKWVLIEEMRANSQAITDLINRGLPMAEFDIKHNELWDQRRNITQAFKDRVSEGGGWNENWYLFQEMMQDAQQTDY
jgi:hypothetical protein